MVLSGLSAMEPFRARGDKPYPSWRLHLAVATSRMSCGYPTQTSVIGKLVGLNVRGRAILVSNTLRTIQLGAFTTVELRTPCILLRVTDQLASR